MVESNSSVNPIRFEALLESVGLKPPLHEYNELVKAWSEPQRAYHTLQHLSECLEKLDWVKTSQPILAKDAVLIELALWYHDAVYLPRKQDNELKSARWASGTLVSAGMPLADVEMVDSMIMATCHGAAIELDANHQLLCDIDLAVLGAKRPRFDEYEAQVRSEYRWVPQIVFRKKRAELLMQFLSAQRLYQTTLFYDYYEHQARANLEYSIAKLGG